jgi:capping protein alpha
MIQVDNGDHKLLITPQGEVSGNEYIDPHSKQVVTFDHITHEVTGTRELAGELDSDVEPFRSAFQEVATHYTSEHYKWGTCGVYSKKDSGNYVLLLCISSAKFEPKNYWTGRWRSVWTITFPSSGNGDVKIQGKVKIDVHYYEDGNVQLNAQQDLSTTAKGGNASALAKSVIEAIKKTEHTYHDVISDNINNMNSGSYKSLRRQLPVTGTLVDWDKIGTLKMGGK